MVWRYACGLFRILKLIFITGFLLQYLGKWYRTNGPLVNFTIFNTSNKNKAGDINSPWNLLVLFFFFAEKVGNSSTTPPLFKESVFSYSPDLAPCDFFLFSETEIRVCVTVKPVLGGIRKFCKQQCCIVLIKPSFWFSFFYVFFVFQRQHFILFKAGNYISNMN